MSRSLAFILSLSILFPLLTGLIRYRNIPVSYRPLIYALGIGLVNEVVCYTLFYSSSNALPTNIYFLCEAMLLTWQFHAWKNTLKQKWAFLLLEGILLASWTIENIVLGRIYDFSPVFQVGYSLILILLSVNQLNWLIVNERGVITRNAVFLICVAIIVFFSYKVLAEIFYYYAPEKIIKNNIFGIESYLNVGYNILLATAISCIPPKRIFILPSR